MIAYIKGEIIAEKSNYIILKVNNIGYKVFTNVRSIKKSETVELFTYHHIREDMSDLYGFSSLPELELFELLLIVNGIGPKAALMIMSASNTDKIINSIVAEDLNFFTAISGIGKKVAAKIILELKPKISNEEGTGVIGKSEAQNEVVDALASLGYKRAEIIGVLPRVPAELTESEDQIRWLLKNLSK